MADEKKTINWTNPSIGVISSNDNKEINELKNEIEELKEEISRLSGEEGKEVSTIETNSEEPVKQEEIEMPFDSPFSEAISSETEEVNNNDVQDILDSVKEDVPEVPVVEEINTPTFDDMLIEDNIEKVSVVINRYNSDLEATTKGKGAKFISLTEGEHAKLLSGKINE